MSILERENAIIDRLKERIPGVAVEALPDIPAERELDRVKEYRLMHPVAALLVVYRGSEFAPSESTDIIVQDERVYFDVIVVAKNLHGHGGAYTWLDAARIALTGFRIPGCDKMYPVDSGFVDEKKGTWFYGLTFAFTTPAIEMDEDEQLPLLKRITTIDNFGDTQEVPDDEV